MYEAPEEERLDLISSLVSALNNAINRFGGEDAQYLTDGTGNWVITIKNDDDEWETLTLSK